MNETKAIQAIHILSERKFLPWVKSLFNRPGWTCLYVILQINKNNHFNKISDIEIEVSVDGHGINQVLPLINRSDIAIYYFLDYTKAELISRSSPHVLNCWYFFGADIYQQTNFFKKHLYGPETKKLLRLLPEARFRYHFRKWYYRLMRMKSTPMKTLERSIPKIDFILWYIEDEIEMLRKRIDLPPWLYLQFFRFSDIIPDEKTTTDKTSKKILIGNSATLENNHLDVLHTLKRLNTGEYQWTLPMTYGQFSRYRIQLKSAFTKAFGKNTVYLETHLPLNEYYELLNRHPTAIFLHYRQQGLGNIFYLLYNGTKVYLSNRNIIFHWLKKHGISAYSFEDEFERDFIDKHLVLTEEESRNNKLKIKELLMHDLNEKTFTVLESNILTKKLKA
jgi:hypothetical protein